MAEDEGMAGMDTYLLIILTVEHTLLDQLHLLLAKRTAGRIQEDEVVVV